MLFCFLPPIARWGHWHSVYHDFSMSQYSVTEKKLRVLGRGAGVLPWTELSHDPDVQTTYLVLVRCRCSGGRRLKIVLGTSFG
jgi:hypothetical protein